MHSKGKETYLLQKFRQFNGSNTNTINSSNTSVFKLKLLVLNIDSVLPTTVNSSNIINSYQPLIDINKLCFQYDITLICCWSHIECARYLETYKAYAQKKTTSIQEKVETEFIPQISKCLSTPNIPSINKTDIVTLLTNFKTFVGICRATEQELILCPGIGELKAKRIYHALHCKIT